MNKKNLLFGLALLFLLGLASNTFAVTTVAITNPNTSANYLQPLQSITFTLVSDKNLLISDTNIDINYSSSATQGTGTKILDDGNLLTDSRLSCNGELAGGDANMATQRTCTFTSWNTNAIGNSYFYILVSDTNRNGVTGFDASDVSFKLGNQFGINQVEFETFSFYLTLMILAMLVAVMALIFLNGKSFLTGGR